MSSFLVFPQAGNHAIVKLVNIVNYCWIIGIRKFESGFVRIVDFGSKNFLDEVQLAGVQFIQIYCVQNGTMAPPVTLVAIALY